MKKEPLKLSGKKVEVPIDPRRHEVVKDAERLIEWAREARNLGDNDALVNLVDGIGIATLNERGYIPVRYARPFYPNYHDRDELVFVANELLHPDKSPKDIYMIILSSMRRC